MTATAKPAPAAPEALMLDIAPLTGARAEGAALYALPEAGALRASFILVPEAGTDAAEVILRLRQKETGALAGPVWLYRWTRAADGSP